MKPRPKKWPALALILVCALMNTAVATTAWAGTTAGGVQPTGQSAEVSRATEDPGQAAGAGDGIPARTGSAGKSDSPGGVDTGADRSDEEGGGKDLLLVIVAGLAIGTVAGLLVRARRERQARPGDGP
ncbi:MAG: hypothetical protein IT199_06065 [Solirubrobacterales bacterium]|nr:hypothetical protein [Solirubrobacterales bacterium]